MLLPDVKAPAFRPDIYDPLPAPAPGPDPYIDYGRTLTQEGGIRLTYKDIDERLRHRLWRIVIWSAASAGEAWFLIHHSPVLHITINVVLWLLAALANWWIVRQPVEIYRGVELRADCMILEDTTLFWEQKMEGYPSFEDHGDSLVLTGIYGTRFVEYLTVRRFDEFDRMPEVFKRHFHDAVMQLWARPEVRRRR